MRMSNNQRVGDALELLRKGLAPFVERELKAAYGDEWPATIVGLLGMEGPQVKKVSLDDSQFLLKVMWRLWQPVFSKVLGQSERTFVSELIDVRNQWAHQETISTNDAQRALDTMQRLLTAVSAEEADVVDAQRQELLRLSYEDQSRKKSKEVTATLFESQTPVGLKPWREVVHPHADVAGGRYIQAEFAADLHQVYQGSGVDEYRDPAEFFRRTYLTDGLTQLLTQAIERMTGAGGVPVVDLQTNFGGGKTHSLLALYHLFSGTPATELPGVGPLMKNAGASSLPEAHRAVLVGTKIAPGQVHEKDDGTRVGTLWGELAWQLDGAEAYKLVADADRTATNPGTALEELFRRYSPCLVLIDEWVAYARQLYGVDGLPAGSFDTHFTFAQTLTEAARAVPGTLVVISIPASEAARAGKSAGESALGDVEVGGEGGRAALERLRNVIGRMESPWRPASADESFEIVRRRLFEPLEGDEAYKARDAVAKVFSEFYRTHKHDFPADCAEAAYTKRIISAFPIHPELFDRLYNDWSTLPRFQRTRGVLRLMANVIHELWEAGDQAPLIMPASVPLNASTVSFELCRYLEEAWKPVIDTDVDGPTSLPLRLDQGNPNFGKLAACRRAARTVFLGSAATLKLPNKGIDDRYIKLGCVLPGESAAVFGDALRRLSDHSSHLYLETGRYWFDTQPSMLQLARDRAAQVTDDEWQMELLRRLREEKSRGEFAALQVAPATSAEVPDEDSVRLVILGPQYHHSSKTESSPAHAAVADILERRGTSPRRNRNMLLFLAPDRTRLAELEAAIRQYLAWSSIEAEAETLNLSAYFLKQAQQKRTQAADAVTQRIPETYSWLLVPAQPEPSKTLVWEETRVTGQDALAVRASRKMLSDESLITRYGSTLLRRELDRIPLWRGDHVGLRQLWEDFAQYLYLPRLRDSAVLCEAVQEGVGSMAWATETFAYAQGVDEEGRYRGLVHGQAGVGISLSTESLVVKSQAATRQLEQARVTEQEMEDRGGLFTPPGEQPPLGGDGIGEPETGVTPKGDTVPAKGNRRFHGVKSLDPGRLNRDVAEISENIVQHLTRLPGASVEVVVEIHAQLPDGFDDATVRTVGENSRTLKFDPSSGFEDD